MKFIQLASIAIIGCTYRTDHSFDQDKTYEYQASTYLGVGDFEFALSCPNGHVLSGECMYTNASPSDQTGWEQSYSWHCSGYTPEITPYGIVTIILTCAPK